MTVAAELDDEVARRGGRGGRGGRPDAGCPAGPQAHPPPARLAAARPGLLPDQPDHRAGQPRCATGPGRDRRRDDGGSARSAPTACFDWAYEGPPTCVHGGVIAEVFDEVLGAANIVAGVRAMTGTLTVRYRKPTPLNTACGRGPVRAPGGAQDHGLGRHLPRGRADRRGRRALHRGRPAPVPGHRRVATSTAPTRPCSRRSGPRPRGRAQRPTCSRSEGRARRRGPDPGRRELPQIFWRPSQ